MSINNQGLATIRIMFVCLGNICRSPLAEGVFRHKVEEAGLSHRFYIDSSGTSAYHLGEQPDRRMRKTAASHGIKLQHQSQQLLPDHLRKFDYILAMDSSNYADILVTARKAGASDGVPVIKTFRSYDPEGGPSADVPDPYYGGAQGFEEVFGIVDRTCDVLLEELKAELK